MDANLFRSYVEKYHRRWLSETVNVSASKGIGIDLVDDTIGIEMKCRLNIYATNYPVHAYQVQQFEENHPEKELFWGFLSYGLTKPVSKIRRGENLIKLITDVEVRLIEWEWIKQFPISSPKTGPYIYVHSKDFPPENTFEKYSKNGGTIYLPKESILEEKINQSTKIESDAPF